MIKNKLEEEHQKQFKSFDNNGNEIDPARGIFPIFVKKNGVLVFLATGFYISSLGHFITAKHVIQEALGINNIPEHHLYTIEFLKNKMMYWRFVRTVAFLDNSDVCAGVMAGSVKHPEEQFRNIALKVENSHINEGDKVFTYAYPETTVKHNLKNQIIKTNPKFYSGKIVKRFPMGRDSVMLPNPCFETNIPIYGGSSGGPVFGGNGEVIGMNSTSFTFNPKISFVSRLDGVNDLELPNGVSNKIIKVGDLAGFIG